MSDAGATPAGWYPDPAGGGGQRWWDGSAWAQQAVGPMGYRMPPPPPTATNGWAAASLVLGVLWLCGLGSIAAVICGLLGLDAIKRGGDRQAGKGLAIAGIVVGCVGLLPWALYVLLLLSGDTFNP